MTTLPRLLLALLPLLAAPAWAQNVVYPPGSGIGLVPPAGMVPATAFSGFEDRATGSSILVADLPAAAFDQIVPGLVPDKLAATGLQAIGAPVAWPVTGGEARLLRATQSANGVTYRKWLLVAHSATQTALLTVQVPKPAGDAMADGDVEAALKTVTLRTPPSLADQVASLPFRIGDLAGFRPSRVLAGSGLILTEGPQDQLSDASQPVLVVASSISGSPPEAERVAFARRGFATIDGVSDLAADAERSFERDDAAWTVIEGTGTYRTTSESLYVAQAVRFAGKGYLRVIGICRLAEKTLFAERFRRVVESLSPK